MNNIKEVFTYENTELSIIKKDYDIWFKAKTIADILEYTNSRKAVVDHVDYEDRITLKDLDSCRNKTLRQKNDPDSYRNETLHQKNDNIIYINESGLYSLILRSKMEKAKKFKKWVTKEVLPSIRKTGNYEFNHKPFKMLTFNIQSEYDLQKKVVNYIRNHHPKALLNATLGENQITNGMRLKSYNMGYQKGSPDLIIQNLHKDYSGFVIEFKNPKGNGKLSELQRVMLQEYKKNAFKVLVSNDYDEILVEIIHYFDGVRIKCKFCTKKLKSTKTLKNHLKYFHKHS